MDKDKIAKTLFKDTSIAAPFFCSFVAAVELYGVDEALKLIPSAKKIVGLCANDFNEDDENVKEQFAKIWMELHGPAIEARIKAKLENEEEDDNSWHSKRS